MRWDLVTSFQVLKKGIYSRAVKYYSGREDFFKENFPRNPQVPQVFLVEMMAQAGGVLFGVGLDFKREVILAKIENMKFDREVAPPCELVIEARVEDESEDGAWILGIVSHEGEPVAEGRILLAAVDAVVEGKKNIVFNEAFMKKYKIHEVVEKSRTQEARVL